MMNNEAARRPTVALSKVLHNDIGYALRKFEKKLGSRHGVLQSMTRQFLSSLHHVLEIPEAHQHVVWKPVSTEVSDSLGLFHEPVPRPPLRLQDVAVVSGAEQWSPDEEHCNTTPRPRQRCFSESREMGCEIGSWQVFETPVKVVRTSSPMGDAMSESADHAMDDKPQLDLVADSFPAVPDECQDSAPAAPDLQQTGDQVQLSVTPPSSVDDTRVVRTIHISLKGSCIGKRQEPRAVEQLVAGATQTMIAKGFASLHQGIDIDSSQVGPIQFVFPCEVSARGFYILFNDYEWECTNFECLTVELTNKILQKEMASPTLKLRFGVPGAVTPASVIECFASRPSGQADE